ncbi:NAD-binding protein [Rhodobacteraceae bacterium 2CG4]|uniref:NAD-binding protein n=2 Tax=Halovulum marinum TaxID=2662447 RepID=A0A6L5Z1N1_9RHOB|nr:NAD-binding protein [Halovulum marinum]
MEVVAMRIGVIGLGDMGSGLAKNVIAAGFECTGFDLAQGRMEAFAALGGIPAASAAEAATGADAVFVMVMTGAQAHDVIVDQVAPAMAPGSVVLLTATILPDEAAAIGRALDGTGIALVDTPVSGGFPGAQNGTLVMMAAGSDAALDRARPAMEAVSATIHRVGTEPGMGQTVKACLQSLNGAIFAGVFESAALAAAAGVKGQVVHDVFVNSSAGCPAVRAALENIIDRRFEGTGSHIATMYKDLTIVMDMARSLGVPQFTASTAMQLFQAGKTRYPNGDNWSVTRITEEITGKELHR